MKRHVTLIEMMIVMFLIALITGVVAYNYRGSLDAGKAFKTTASIERIEAVLNLAAAEGADVSAVTTTWQQTLKDSPLIKNPENYFKDGWGSEFIVTSPNGVITVYSQKLEEYQAKKTRVDK